MARVPPYSRTQAGFYPYGAVTRCGPPFQTVPVLMRRATGLVRVRSPLLTESRLMSFPPATEMFQFAGFASTYDSGPIPSRGGLPHSEIFGSPGAPPSPKLFAGCHVLHRLSVPRHPPDALLSLENLSIPMRQHTMSENRCRMSDLTALSACCSQRKSTHTNTHGRPTDVRGRMPDVRTTRRLAPTDSHPSQHPYSIRQASPPPNLTGRPAPRRLPKPSSRVQEPEVRCQMPGEHRHRTAPPKINQPNDRRARRRSTALTSVLRHLSSGMEPIGVEPTTS